MCRIMSLGKCGSPQPSWLKFSSLAEILEVAVLSFRGSKSLTKVGRKRTHPDFQPTSCLCIVRTTWSTFLSQQASRDAAGDAIYSAIFDAAPELQHLFKSLVRISQASMFKTGWLSGKVVQWGLMCGIQQCTDKNIQMYTNVSCSWMFLVQ